MYNAGDFNTTETVNIPVNTFDSNDPTASVTVTDLAAGDIEIHKDGSTTQRASDSGVTVSINFDGVTGNHMIHIDLSDNTDAGFYSSGSRYLVRVEGITVDSGTLNSWVGGFSIDCVLRPTTAGRTLDVETGGCAGVDWANVANQGTSVDLSATAIDLCDEVTTNSDMRGTDNAALASVLGALADAAADGDPTTGETVMQYVKQLINVLVGSAGVVTFPSEAAPGNAVSLAEVLRAVYNDVTGLNGDAMRGTDSAALAATALTNVTWTDVLAGYLDAAISSRSVAGDEMNLSDDAITSAKYDETTAFPLKADDSGNTYILRTGADGDTGETLSDQIDGCNTVTPDAAGTAASLHAITDGLISALNNLSAAQVNAECDTAISDAALATASALATVDSLVDTLIARLTATRAGYLDNLTNLDAAISSRNSVTPDVAGTAAGLHSTTDALISALNNLSAAQVNSECDTAISDAALATASALATVDGLVDTLISRLTAVRAGYLDNLSGGAVALASTALSNAVWTAAKAAFIDAAISSVSAGDATSANQTTIINHLTSIKDNNAGADFDSSTDSLEAIRNRGDAAWVTGGGLSGSNAIIFTIQDGSGNNITEAAVEIWDSANTTFYEKQFTNSSGQVSSNIDDGTYTVRIHKGGYTFSNQTLVVSGAASETYTGTALIPTEPSSADSCRVYEYLKEGDGVTIPSTASGYAKIVSLPEDLSDSLHLGNEIEATYDSDTGLIYWDIVRGAEVQFIIYNYGVKTTKTVPDSATARLTDIT